MLNICFLYKYLKCLIESLPVAKVGASLDNVKSLINFNRPEIFFETQSRHTTRRMPNRRIVDRSTESSIYPDLLTNSRKLNQP